MGLEISKRRCYGFRLMSAKLHEDIGYHGEIRAITFLCNRPRFKNIVPLGNINMGISEKT